MKVEPISIPGPVTLKRAKLHLPNGESVSLEQRRTYSNHEWGVESTAEFLSRIQEVAYTKETHGIEVLKFTTSSAASHGIEIVKVELNDLMNRFTLLDYLTAHLYCDDVKLNDTSIEFTSITDRAKELRNRDGHTYDVFDSAWGPSVSLSQAMILATDQKLSINWTKGMWVVEAEGGHSQCCPSSELSLEIVRTAVRRLYHNRPILVPLNFFTALGQVGIANGQPCWTSEAF